MTLSVVTSFSPTGLHEYGYNFIESFDVFWPPEVSLIMYAEKPMPRPQSRVGRKMIVRRLDDVQGFIDFNARWKHDNAANGRAPHPSWKQKYRDDGYSFRTDAMKFCRKVFAVHHAAHEQAGGILTWIDADVKCLARTRPDFVPKLLDGDDIAYLGRERTHSECGFLAFHLPYAFPVIDAWEEFYRTDAVFKLDQWHDSHVFDIARDDHPEVRCNNLTPAGSGHVWCQSPLVHALDHLKGERKELGYSPERLEALKRMGQ